MASPLVDPRLAAELGDFYDSLCTIEALPASDDETQDALGAPVDDWAAVDGLEHLACAISPAVQDTPGGAGERRRPTRTVIANRFIVEMPAYHAGITSQHRAVVDDVAYAILGNAEHDSLRTMTRLSVEIVST